MRFYGTFIRFSWLAIALSACQHDPQPASTSPSITTAPLSPAPTTTNVNLSSDDLASDDLNIVHSPNFAAHWIAPNLILLPAPSKNSDASSQPFLVKQTLAGQERLPLLKTSTPTWLADKHPHLTTFQAYQVKLSDAQVKLWLKEHVFVAFANENHNQANAPVSYLQTAAVIDVLYTQGDHDADEQTNFGAKIQADQITFTLWAPTAKNVRVYLYNQDKSPAIPAYLKMSEDTNTGSWQATTALVNKELFYQYQVEVYHPASQQFEQLKVTDPYSLSLSTNSEFSQVINLDDSGTMPKGWQQQQDVLVAAPEDNIFYETHIRDFSAHDPLLANPKFKGKYQAFTEKNSAGMQHLISLQQAGINSIHLLPSFDIGTINENKHQAIDLDDPIDKLCKLSAENQLCHQAIDKKQTIKTYLSGLAKDSDTQQAVVSAIKALDNYNWGYDPFHYSVPEGSYAVNPEGTARIVEFREMIQSLHNLGFRVIMDVVYNHTHQAGLAPTALLDKIVPNYYHRLDPITGAIAQSTCCDNTATEHVMMAKLMTDSLQVWARDYKIDGFRFDLMAHQPKAVMLKAREAVRAIDPDTYFYGEGWNFGEVANNQRFEQASQLSLVGSEIGTYTDRLRDAVRGGAFSASGDDIRKSQGIGSGLATWPNELTNPEQSRKNYLLFADQLRIGLAANLANFPLENAQGEFVHGKDIPYGDQPTGYALDPADTINYVSKHDNQTLWDNNQYRLPFNTSTKDRVRIHLQSLAFPILAQGIPFLHMGSELLRSKSFLRDSYDYGDWFNKVDFTKQSNNYQVGLPPAEKDQANWTLIKQLIQNNEGRDLVSAADIEFSAAVFNELIQLRMSSPLFRLTTSEAIIARVKFHNTGKDQQIGLIVMSIDDSLPAEKLDKNYAGVVVIFNTSAEQQFIHFPEAQRYQLHPIQQQSIDPTVKLSASSPDQFRVPALTTSIFVLKNENAHLNSRQF